LFGTRDHAICFGHDKRTLSRGGQQQMALASTDQQWHAVGQCMWPSTQLVVMIRVLLLRVAVGMVLLSPC
jgi:hypothetical protein